MKKTIALSIVAALGLSAYSCSGGAQTTAQIIANIVSHSQQACTDLQLLGEPVGIIATEVAGANPRNTAIGTIIAKLAAGQALANSDCQTLAASFTAEAPKSMLTAEIKIDRAILDRIK